MSRTLLASGPITRNWTGKPTGGPKLKRSTRTRASVSMPSAAAFSILRLDALARLDVLGDDDDLGKGLVRQLRIEAEPEARRALADIGRVGLDVLVVLEQRLGLLHRLLGDVEGGALGQAELEEQLGPLRQREELLLDMAEADDRGDEDADGRQPPR